MKFATQLLAGVVKERAFSVREYDRQSAMPLLIFDITLVWCHSSRTLRICVCHERICIRRLCRILCFRTSSTWNRLGDCCSMAHKALFPVADCLCWAIFSSKLRTSCQMACWPMILLTLGTALFRWTWISPLGFLGLVHIHLSSPLSR